jgi:hypothetical protein
MLRYHADYTLAFGKEGLIMKQFPLFPMDLPATYRICVVGGVDSAYAERYWGMKPSIIEPTGEPAQTTLVGEVTDQAALVGIINALYNAGHTVLSVERIHSDVDHPLEDRNKET